MSALATLSLSTIVNEESQSYLSAMPANMREEIERQRAEKQEEATKAAATEVLGLIEKVQERAKMGRAQIRNYKECIQREKAAMDKRDRALQYGMETQNYVPLMVCLGMGFYEHGRKTMTRAEWISLSEIPEGWTPKAPDAE